MPLSEATISLWELLDRIFTKRRPSLGWSVALLFIGLVTLAIWNSARRNEGLPDGFHWLETGMTLGQFFTEKGLQPYNFQAAIQCRSGSRDFEGNIGDHKWVDASGEWVKSPVGTYDRYTVKWDKEGWREAQNVMVNGLIALWPLAQKSRPEMPNADTDYHGASWGAPVPTVGLWAGIDQQYGAVYGLRHDTWEDGPGDFTRFSVTATDARQWTENICNQLAATYETTTPWPENFLTNWGKNRLDTPIEKPRWGYDKTNHQRVWFSATQRDSSDRGFYFELSEDNLRVDVSIGNES